MSEEFDEERLKAFDEAVRLVYEQATVADPLNNPELVAQFRARMEFEEDGRLHIYNGDTEAMPELGGWTKAEYREVMRRAGFAKPPPPAGYL